jgi:hypothetical protein
MTWHLGLHVAVAWLSTVALAGVIYFVPMTRFIDNLSDRVIAAAGPFLRTQHALGRFIEHDTHHLISAA